MTDLSELLSTLCYAAVPGGWKSLEDKLSHLLGHDVQAAEAQPHLGWFSSRKLEFCQNENFPTEHFKHVNAFPLENYSSGNCHPLLLHI